MVHRAVSNNVSRPIIAIRLLCVVHQCCRMNDDDEAIKYSLPGDIL